jgi:hypothetical protein
MTTPSTNTPYSVINSAMREAGLLQEGDEANSEQLALHMGRLNDLVNLWQTQGLKLWLQVDTAITLTAGKGGQGNPYTLKPSGDINMVKPLRVLQGYYLDSSGTNRRPIFPLSRDEWMRLSTVSQTGQVTQYFVDKQQLSLDVYTWLIPDATAATGSMHLLLQTQVGNSVSLTDAVAFPVEWSIALRWGLAEELCTGQPITTIQRCTAKALFYREMLEDWDVEDSPVQFQPDQRIGGGTTFS